MTWPFIWLSFPFYKCFLNIFFLFLPGLVRTLQTRVHPPSTIHYPTLQFSGSLPRAAAAIKYNPYIGLLFFTHKSNYQEITSIQTFKPKKRSLLYCMYYRHKLSFLFICCLFSNYLRKLATFNPGLKEKCTIVFYCWTLRKLENIYIHHWNMSLLQLPKAKEASPK